MCSNSCNSIFPPSDLSQAYLWAYNNNVCPVNVSKFKAYLSGYNLEKFQEHFQGQFQNNSIQNTKTFVSNL